MEKRGIRDIYSSMWEKTKERIAVAQVIQYLVNSLVDVRWLNGTPSPSSKLRLQGKGLGR